MKEQFVTYEIALKLKELGFNETCFSMFDNNGELYHGYQSYGKVLFDNSIDENYNANGIKIFKCAAPLWQQVISFLKSKGVLVSELWDGWEYAKDGEDFKYCKTIEQAILASLELITK